ncbi:uncharacterized protein LOC106156477 [Lingula anatina]|uniref:Uncharacterized protein LOC106156477 n=1 Tax=Lingula anatina TaxID=7574 RepID=A0A1S3HM86_LINAN|nr:uncharacterized protein LOC106156477 [Lingula anatina]XP_013387194.1 uncharacterized protein LOC106156477 [Lingula anatina]XP_013387195.1 uncharacterized protein LOC106156477 [Lingula anatina]|eukprot:XP_013387193.1 uncharacterized protein LOC106156477 [Lingula anatina]
MKFHVITVILSVVSMVTNIYCASVNDAKPQLTAREIGELICNATDSNNDGIITKLEWIGTEANMDFDHNDEVTHSELLRYMVKLDSRIRPLWSLAIFESADFDKNGVLTEDDMFKFGKLDADGSGQTDKDECIELCEKFLKEYDPTLE